MSIDPRQVSGSNMHSNQENISVKIFWMNAKFQQGQWEWCHNFEQQDMNKVYLIDLIKHRCYSKNDKTWHGQFWSIDLKLDLMI